MAFSPTLDYLSPHEFSRLSGLSIATVRRYLAAGQIPRAQPAGRGGRLLIPRSALDGLVRLPASATQFSDDRPVSTATQWANLPGRKLRWLADRGPKPKA